MDMMYLLKWIAIIMMVCGLISVMGGFYFFFDGLLWFMIGTVVHTLLGELNSDGG